MVRHEVEPLTYQLACLGLARGDAIELTVFPTGRAIIKGVTEPEAARTLYAKYIGA